MIDANSKTNSFLKAIEKYAEEQKSMMRAEIEAFREDQLNRANDEGTAAAFAFIQREKAKFKASLAKEVSIRETKMKHELFAKRNKMAESIFDEAAEKLKKFAGSNKYADYIKNSAKLISDFAAGKKVVVYISPKDSKFKKQLTQTFSGNCEIIYDNAIKIGGIRCYCEEMSIVADETLDRKFEDRKRWFINNSKFMIE